MGSHSLEGKIALVTGGSRGIGRAIALALAEAGADVAIAARGQEALQAAAAEIEGLGRKALPIQTDVTDLGQVEAMVTRAVETFGGLDVLVNNAGAAPFLAPLDQIRPDGFDKYFRINFTAALMVTRAAAGALLSRGSACVVNIASVAGLTATPGLSYYGTAKAALIQLTKTLALEWAPNNVRVNAVAPGWIETDMNAIGRANEDFNRRIVESIPMRRWGKAEEVAAATVFLASPAASFITGATLVVDGGQTVSNTVGI